MMMLCCRVIARQCQDTCQLQGLTIPSGMLVQANVWALHRDPLHWGDDTETFDPLRYVFESMFSLLQPPSPSLSLSLSLTSRPVCVALCLSWYLSVFVPHLLFDNIKMKP